MDNFLVPANLNSSKRPFTAASRTLKTKNYMSANAALTFRELTGAMRARVSTGEVPASILPNLESAFRAFLRGMNLTEEQAVGSAFRASYYRNLRAHTEALREEGRHTSYIANRKSLLGKWCSLVTQLDEIAAAATNSPTPLQTVLNDLLERSQTTVAELSRAAGLSKSTLGHWLKGTRPNERARPSLHRLERFFALEVGSLQRLARSTKRHAQAQTIPTPAIAYRERLSQRTQDTYRLKEVSPALKKEWMDFVVHKTDDFPVLHRYARGFWIATDLHAESNTERKWFCFIKGKFVPTASIVWAHASSYLGWLARPTSEDGGGMTLEEVQTIAWFSDKIRIHRFVRWLTERSDDKVHRGILTFVAFVAALNHPDHGYLTQCPELHQSLPATQRPATWKDACREAFNWAIAAKKGMAKRGTVNSRVPTEPIKRILELPNPMEAVADMIARMKSSRPDTGGIEEAIWARDILLIKLMASNPLRAKNLKILTYLPDNSGNLYRKSDGSWHIRIDRRAFKNADGAARDRNYDMPVAQSVWGDIERYLSAFRLMLPGSSAVDYVFLSSKPSAKAGPWSTLNKRVFYLTRTYLWGSAGIGSHGFRYIAPTAILKQAPGAWDAAAAVLHDEVDTVKAHYAHLRSSDSGAYVHALLGSAFSRM